MIDRFRRGAVSLPPATREFSIPPVSHAETCVVHAFDVTLRLSAVIVVVIVVSALTEGAVPASWDRAFLLALAGIAGLSSVRYLRLRFK
ncbi:hypothetical protein AB0I10_40260 [Streptomyces sp. NPDC050636]|uniref:hypothetical protein n=1 Tax=Streptomyces sp. NPDC050636 TaxID=3154510 RepID=UPI0034323154